MQCSGCFLKIKPEGEIFHTILLVGELVGAEIRVVGSNGEEIGAEMTGFEVGGAYVGTTALGIIIRPG
jgi:hypothetical protein